jgi:hypothetical protein
VSNPDNWTPTGVPSTGDTAVIATGLAVEIGNVLHGIPITLGNANPVSAPTLQLINAGTSDVDVGTFTGSVPIAPPQYANLVTIGNNTVDGAVGGALEGEPDQSTLTIRNVGSLQLTGPQDDIFDAPSRLNGEPHHQHLQQGDLPNCAVYECGL